MAIITPAPSMIGGISLLAAVEMIMAIHFITCLYIVTNADSTDSTLVGGVRISPYMQCINASWFLLGLPIIIVGGFGACYRVESQLRAYFAYLVGTLLVTIAWLLIFMVIGSSCNTREMTPWPASYLRASDVAPIVICRTANSMMTVYMLFLVVLVAGAVYLVWSMLLWVRGRLATELLRYQEPWMARMALADDSLEEHSKLYQERKKISEKAAETAAERQAGLPKAAQDAEKAAKANGAPTGIVTAAEIRAFGENSVLKAYEGLSYSYNGMPYGETYQYPTGYEQAIPNAYGTSPVGKNVPRAVYAGGAKNDYGTNTGGGRRSSNIC